jgi:urease alpha subunit
MPHGMLTPQPVTLGAEHAKYTQMSDHLSAHQLRQFALHQVGPKRMRIVRHLEACDDCRVLLKQQREKAKTIRSLERSAFTRQFGES